MAKIPPIVWRAVKPTKYHLNHVFFPKMRISKMAADTLDMTDTINAGVVEIQNHLIILISWLSVRSASCIPAPQ